MKNGCIAGDERDQGSEIRDQGSEIRDQGSEAAKGVRSWEPLAANDPIVAETPVDAT